MAGTDVVVINRTAEHHDIAWSPQRPWFVVDAPRLADVRRPVSGRIALAVGVSLLVHVAALMLVMLNPWTSFDFVAAPGIELVFEPAPPQPVPDAVPVEPSAVEPLSVESPAEPAAPAQPAQPEVSEPAEIRTQRLPDVPRPALREPQPAAPSRRPARVLHPASPVRPAAPEATAPRAAVDAPVIPPSPVVGMEANRPPIYPEAALRRREQGRVMVRAHIAPDGTPTDVDVAETSGHPNLDAAALAAVRQWRFIPATRAGRPVPAIAEVPVRFRLDN